MAKKNNLDDPELCNWALRAVNKCLDYIQRQTDWTDAVQAVCDYQFMAITTAECPSDMAEYQFQKAFKKQTAEVTALSLRAEYAAAAAMAVQAFYDMEEAA